MHAPRRVGVFAGHRLVGSGGTGAFAAQPLRSSDPALPAPVPMMCLHLHAGLVGNDARHNSARGECGQVDLAAATVAVTIQADRGKGAAVGVATGIAVVHAERDQVVLDPLSAEQPATPAAEQWDVGGACCTVAQWG